MQEKNCRCKGRGRSPTAYSGVPFNKGAKKEQCKVLCHCEGAKRLWQSHHNCSLVILDNVKNPPLFFEIATPTARNDNTHQSPCLSLRRLTRANKKRRSPVLLTRLRKKTSPSLTLDRLTFLGFTKLIRSFP